MTTGAPSPPLGTQRVDGAVAATALIADDEPLLREHLAAHLARLWPALAVVAQARNGREAVTMFDEHTPDIVFLDVQMPGMNGVEAARAIGDRAQIVFVTAFEQYALDAFERGAVDYLVKPFDEARLAQTVARLQQRRVVGAGAARPADASLQPLLEMLSRHLAAASGSPQAPGPPGPTGASSAPGTQRPAPLQWIRASVGASVRLIPVDEVIYLRSDEKYTLVVWQGGEALIRKTIRELADELDPERFVQTHRSVIVAMRHVAQVVRGANDTADVHLRGRPEVLSVSRSYLHLFRQM